MAELQHRLGRVDERRKREVIEREIIAWNRGDLGAVIAELDRDHMVEVMRRHGLTPAPPAG